MTEHIFCEYCGKRIEDHISTEHLIGTNHLHCFLEKQLYDDDYRLEQWSTHPLGEVLGNQRKSGSGEL